MQLVSAVGARSPPPPERKSQTMDTLKAAILSGDRDAMVRAVGELGLQPTLVAVVTEPGPSAGGAVSGFFVEIDSVVTLLDVFVVPVMRAGGVSTKVLQSDDVAKVKTTPLSPAFAAMMRSSPD